jgi:hypothetical protein
MISSLAISDIAILTASGATLKPEEVITLNALACKITACEKCTEIATPPRICWAGETILHEPTIQSGTWYDTYARRWWGHDFISASCSLYWSCAHARERGFFEDKTDVKAVKAMVEKWFNSLDCTLAQLHIAAAYVVGFDNLDMTAEDEEKIREAATGQNCPYSNLMRNVIAEGLGLSQSEIMLMTKGEARDIIDRHTRQQIAAQGGDKKALIEHLKRSAQAEYFKYFDELARRYNGQ